MTDKTKKELLNLAEELVSQDLTDVLLLREFVYKWRQSDLPIPEEFWFLVAVESETDYYPNSDLRANFSEDYLEKIESRASSYLARVDCDIKESLAAAIRELNSL